MDEIFANKRIVAVFNDRKTDDYFEEDKNGNGMYMWW